MYNIHIYTYVCIDIFRQALRHRRFQTVGGPVGSAGGALCIYLCIYTYICIYI